MAPLCRWPESQWPPKVPELVRAGQGSVPTPLCLGLSQKPRHSHFCLCLGPCRWAAGAVGRAGPWGRTLGAVSLASGPGGLCPSGRRRWLCCHVPVGVSHGASLAPGCPNLGCRHEGCPAVPTQPCLSLSHLGTSGPHGYAFPRWDPSLASAWLCAAAEGPGASGSRRPGLNPASAPSQRCDPRSTPARCGRLEGPWASAPALPSLPPGHWACAVCPCGGLGTRTAVCQLRAC